MTNRAYNTPDEVETAFYEAFESSDAQAMEAVWENSETIACIHPMGAIIQGASAVHESWRQILMAGKKMHFDIKRCQMSHDQSLAIHTVLEHIYLSGESHSRPPILATNIYRKSEQGWRMIFHHASPFIHSEESADTEDSESMPALH